MKVSKIRISNILGIDELEFEPGRYTEVAGHNGAGKTSVLEAIKSAIKGGHDATLLRQGAEKGEIVLVLDNGMEITKRVTPTKSDTVVERDGMKASRPAETIKALADLLSVNPIDFLRAPKKERVNVLLEAMPMQADIETLSVITGTDASWVADLPALEAIAQLHKQIYDERTGINRAAREKQSTISQLRGTLPDMSADSAPDTTALTEQLAKLTEAKDAELERIDNKLEGLRARSNERIAELQRQIDIEKAAFADILQKANRQREKTLSDYNEQRNAISSKLSAAQAVADQLARAQQTRDTIAAMESDVKSLVSEAAEKTAALTALEAYKATLLESLPIPGLEVRDGEIYRGGVPFDRLNTAQQVQIAIELAKLRAGKLGLICVDGIELLDSKSYEEFKRQALASGLQLVVARVADSEFTINTEPGAA